MFKTLWAAVEICIWGSSNLNINITQQDDSYAGGKMHLGLEGCHEGLLHQVNEMIYVNACEDLWPVWMEERCGLIIKT